MPVPLAIRLPNEPLDNISPNFNQEQNEKLNTLRVNQRALRRYRESGVHFIIFEVLRHLVSLIDGQSGSLIVSGIGVTLGGLITYFIALRRQKYELRRDAYLAFMDLRIKGGYPIPGEWTRYPLFSRELYLAKYKIDLIGSKQIKDISTKMVLALYPNSQIIDDEYKPRETRTVNERIATELDTAGRWDAFKNICDKELKPAIQKELGTWFPFDL